MKSLHLKLALLPKGWARNVLISINNLGYIHRIKHNVSGANQGCLLPGMANLHSHAHQRAMAGLAERAGKTRDSFWTWRETMYRFLDTISPEQLQAIAAQLYVEMLKAGYTHVAEFQYLHHQANGTHFNDTAEMCLRILAAANEAGIGLTNLPVYYQFGGFGAQPVSHAQRRFVNDPEQFLRIVETMQNQSQTDANIVTGIAAHSLRAVTAAGFNHVLAGIDHSNSMPVHIHIAEQRKEVQDCIAWSGRRPIEYLYDQFSVDHNWCLIHATHMTKSETKQVAESGAVAGLCPSTEANLGDGLFNAHAYLQAKGKFGIGSDSNISISPTEELRWLEYGQRLTHQSRNQLSGGYEHSTGRNLFEHAVTGGAQACGHDSGAISVGMRADFIVLDTDHPLLAARDGDEIIDSWIFSGNQNTVRDVYVGGKQLIKDGHHANEEIIKARFVDTLGVLRAV